MRVFAFVLFLTLTSLSGIGQAFYEIQWEADREYTALVVFYDQEAIDVRVKYIDDAGVYHVAKYTCIGSYEYDDDGTEYFIFNGSDAEIVYSSEDVGAIYTADNFIFTHLSPDNEFEELYTIDNNGLEQDNMEAHMTSASFRQINPEKDFTEQYVFNFFDAHEPEYAYFLALANANTEQEPTPVAVVPSTLHLFFAADTKDRSIGSSTQQDLEEITTTFNKISRELGMEIREYHLVDQAFTKAELTNQLKSVNIEPDDILVYYYSGHGYNDTKRSSEFPTMALDGPDYALEDIYQEVKQKNARLSLIIGDLCNSIPGTRTAVGQKENIPFKSGYLFDSEKLKKMFLESSGTILSTSSEKGQYSYCMNNPDGSLGGGHFTYAFIESMIKEASMVSDGKGDWQTVLERAYTKAHTSTQGHINQNGSKGQSGFGQLNITN